MKCKNHIEAEATNRCSGCQEVFCENCLIELEGKTYCGECKVMAVRETPIIMEESQRVPCDEAKTALTYAIIGLFCFGFIFGPMALVKAKEARDRIKDEPELTGDGKIVVAIILAILGIFVWIERGIVYISDKF